MKLFKWRSSKKGGKKKILVADDEPNIVRTIADRLEMSGYDVVTASDGLEAFERAQEESPDVIILDIIMPGLDGHGVLERIRQSDGTKHIPVIMLTAQSGTEDVFRANAAGANGYLVKPFDLVELFDEIEKALSVKSRG